MPKMRPEFAFFDLGLTEKMAFAVSLIRYANGLGFNIQVPRLDTPCAKSPLSCAKAPYLSCDPRNLRGFRPESIGIRSALTDETID